MAIKKNELYNSLWKSCIAHMHSFLPLWQHYREELNRAPLGHMTWEY